MSEKSSSSRSFHSLSGCLCNDGPHNEIKEIVLEPNSDEYNKWKGFVDWRMEPHVTRITRVCSPTLEAWYKIKRAEYESRNNLSEGDFLHVTDACNVQSILERNLSWRKTRNSRYGKGVSFAVAHGAWYAHKWHHRNMSEEGEIEKAMIVCKVLVGNSEEGDWNQEIPSEGMQTTTGNRFVIVKYRDDEFCPRAIIYYNDYQVTY